MNKKANVFRSAVIFTLIIVALLVLAIISPTINSLQQTSSAQAGLTGLEKLIFENITTIFFLLGTAAIFMLASSSGGQ